MEKHEKKSRLIKWFSALPKWRKLTLCILSALLSAAIIATSTLAIFGQLDEAIEVISGKHITNRAEDPYLAVNAGNTPKYPITADPDPVGATLLASYIRKGTDYDLNGNWKKQISSAISSISKYGFNCIILSLNCDGDKIYGGDTDILDYVIKEAEKKSLAVYGEYSLLAKKGGRYNISNDQHIAEITGEIEHIVTSYALSGILITDYYTEIGDGDYSAYIKSGSGMGFDAYLRDRLASTIDGIGKAINKISEGITYGITADAVWASKEAVEGGFECKNEVFQALTNGHADTVLWLNKGYADCVFVSIPYSTRDADIPFGNIAKWWSTMVGGKAGLNFTLAAYNVGSGETWDSPTQLADQLASIPALSASGYAFDSISALVNDKTDNTKNAVKYLNDNDLMGITELSFTSVYSDSFTTYSKTLSFTGASDPMHPLKMNSAEVKRTARGYFSFNVVLKEGKNTFTFEHKGKKRTFTVTYEAILIKRVAPRSDQQLNGGSVISVSVTARNGSIITATLNGQTIKLSQIGTIDNDTAIKQEFYDFTGVFKLPASKDTPQNLGNIRFNASCGSLSEYVDGGKITIRSKDDVVINSSGGSYQSGYGIQVGVGTRYVAEVTTQQAETFDGSLIDERSRPTNAYLPAGTVDYCNENDIIFYNSSSSDNAIFRQLDYGKRIYTDDVAIFKATLPETNSITLKSTEIVDRHTVMTFDTQWKAPFNVTLGNQSYKNPYKPNDRPDYTVDSVTFNYIDIEFCYTVSAQGKIVLDNHPVFSKGEWIKSGSNYVLRLHLKSAGSFYGWTAQYNEKNQLEFYFLNPAKITAAPTYYGYRLDGVVIMLDPGHGGKSDPGAVGSNNTNTEAVLNLFLANKIKRELENIGATVVMTRTSNVLFHLYERNAMSNEIKPDIFISIHRNGSSSTSANGYSNFYFQPYSKALAKAVYDRTVQAFDDKRNYNYYPFYVTRISCCPAILTENGFMTNAMDFAKIQTDSHNELNAYYTVQGIVDYFVSIQQ
ncbi:MAG: N-acetylmuramoyl-L-alanine amidase [Clostridia bacterium]|nr:N-acetylmuramoyl-L-alanine amidase [Clostridia bacterium]